MNALNKKRGLVGMTAILFLGMRESTVTWTGTKPDGARWRLSANATRIK